MKKVFLILAVLGLLGVIGVLAAAFYGYQQLQPVKLDSSDTVNFVVPKGQSVLKIGQRLQDAGLIHHPLAFRFVTWRNGLSNKLQAGSFELSPGMTTSEIAEALTQGTNDIWITVLEGWRVEEIAEMLERQGLPAFDKAEFLTLAKSQEGYLFPDTYLIPRLATAETISQLLRDTFEQKVEKGLAEEIADSGKSLKDIVIMASLIEREANEPAQMRVVSGILWNRIDQDMGLNVDATLQYLRGYDQAQQTWWAPPSVSDKDSSSPFNTYKFAGLPPQPIANPSLEAIKASIAPQRSNYLYYIHDTRGQLHYAETLQQHNANVQKYLR